MDAIPRKPHQEALAALRPGAEYVMQGDQYDGLIWLDKDWPAPSKDEFYAKVAEIQADIAAQAKADTSDAVAAKAALIKSFIADGKIDAKSLPATSIALSDVAITDANGIVAETPIAAEIKP